MVTMQRSDLETSISTIRIFTCGPTSLRTLRCWAIYHTPIMSETTALIASGLVVIASLFYLLIVPVVLGQLQSCDTRIVFWIYIPLR